MIERIVFVKNFQSLQPTVKLFLAEKRKTVQKEGSILMDEKSLKILKLFEAAPEDVKSLLELVLTEMRHSSEEHPSCLQEDFQTKK